MREQQSAEKDVTVPASLVEDIHYHLSRYDGATSKTDAGRHLANLWSAVHDLTSWHPGYDINSGTMPWERDDEDLSTSPEQADQ